MPDQSQKNDELSDSHLRAYCRALATDLPRGVVGCSIAAEVLAGVPEARVRRLPDVTGSATAVFRALVAWGLLRSMPSARVMAAALAHLAALSPLVERRSARQWTLRLSQLQDGGSAVAMAVQKRVSPGLLDLADDAPGVGPRMSSIRAERDRLLEEIRVAEDRVAAAEERVHTSEQQASMAEDRARVAEGRERVAEDHARAADRTRAAADVRTRIAEEQAGSANERARIAEERASAAETRARFADKHSSAAEERARAAAERARAAEVRARECERQTVAAEERAKVAQLGLFDANDRILELEKLVNACWQALGQPTEPLDKCITADRSRRESVEKAREQLQKDVDGLTKELRELRVKCDELQKADATMAELRKKVGLLSETLNSCQANVRDMRSERASIRSMLAMDLYSEHTEVELLSQRLTERAEALEDLAAIRRLCPAPQGDPRSLHERLRCALGRK